MHTEDRLLPGRGDLPRALTVAGSDPSGGAGIQADLKTFTVLGVYGMAAITAVTAQNTQEVRTVQGLPGELVNEQVRSCLADIRCDAVKTGMLWNREIMFNVQRALREFDVDRLVVDPVFAATSGGRLIEKAAVQTLVDELFPMALLVTPNAAESEALSGRRIVSMHDMSLAAREIYRLGPRAVLIKGGHLSGQPVDLLFDGREKYFLEGERIRLDATHGTGCTLSAAITAYLASGHDLLEAVPLAKEFVTEALRRSVRVGRGAVPANHLHGLVSRRSAGDSRSARKGESAREARETRRRGPRRGGRKPRP